MADAGNALPMPCVRACQCGRGGLLFELGAICPKLRLSVRNLVHPPNVNSARPQIPASGPRVGFGSWMRGISAGTLDTLHGCGQKRSENASVYVPSHPRTLPVREHECPVREHFVPFASWFLFANGRDFCEHTICICRKWQKRRILQEAMHLRYCLPAQGFEICIFKIIYGRDRKSVV